MELEEPTASVILPPDARPAMPELPSVRLLAIADVHLHATAALEKALTGFYVGQLKFERDIDDAKAIAFNAEKFRIVFKIVDSSPPRDDYRPIQIQTPLFDDFVRGLHASETPFEWQRGTSAGLETVFLQDPAGYWVSVGPIRTVP